MSQIITFSFFRVSSKWEAFKKMGMSSVLIEDLRDASFGKLLGTGAGNGFSIFPDLSLYGLLLVWPDINTAKTGLSSSKELKYWFDDASSYGTLFMETCKVHGTWDGKQPFEEVVSPQRDLFSFWKDVPSVSKSLNHSPEGLYSANGVGEWPLIQQATFSVWQNVSFVENYAYHGEKHRKMVAKTRQTGWYSEELFARFHILGASGHWPAWKNIKDVATL
jgi:hypothetical protein